MAKKYNYYELRENVKAGGKLPDDINKFVHDKLVERGLVAASNRLKTEENCLGHTTTIAFKKSNPMLRIEFNMSYGMVEGFDIVHEHFVGEEVVLTKKHIKNPLLDMSKKGLIK
jgi:hypothetical protein